MKLFKKLRLRFEKLKIENWKYEKLGVLKIRKIDNSKNWKFWKLKIRKGWKIENWRWKGNLRRGLNFFVEFFQNHFFMSGPSRIYASLFYLLMYFDVCQNEILIKCHAVRNKLERQYSNSDEWSDIRPDFYFWANLTLKIGNRAWTVKNWNFHNCCPTQFTASLFSSQVAKNPSFMRFCCFWSY